MGKFMIINARGSRLLEKNSWQYTVRQDNHLSMSIVLDELAARAKTCPFPTCQSSTEGIEIENGGRICRACGRWSRLTPQKLDVLGVVSDISSPLATSSAVRAVDSNNCSNTLQTYEDIELYRQDALRYLNQVKVHYLAQPEKYEMFLNIMEDFKRGAIGTRGVMEQVLKLHDGNAVLVEGFNAFLPPGYRTVYNQSEGFSFEYPNDIVIAAPDDAVVINEGYWEDTTITYHQAGGAEAELWESESSDDDTLSTGHTWSD
ncbi:MAG: hypothetical protein Q9176_008100 [Flavoplaca citrina]